LPLLVQRDAARLQAGHFEEVGHQVMHGMRLVADDRGRLDGAFVERRLPVHQGIGEPDETRQRCPQIVRQGGQDRCAQPLRGDLQFAVLRGIGVMQPLERDRQQRCHRFQQGSQCTYPVDVV